MDLWKGSGTFRSNNGEKTLIFAAGINGIRDTYAKT